MNDPNNELLIQITAGRGPEECCWVAARVLKILLFEATEWGLSHMVLSREPAKENGTLYSAAVKLEGDRREEFFSRWEGSILWVGQSPYRKFHKRKNWFVGVNRLKLAEDSFSLDEQDVRYKAVRAGGPGGQHVNKVSTAIRATHLPSNVSVLVSDHRSQLQNRKAAKERLAKTLVNHRRKDQQAKIKTNWQQRRELERGKPVRVFKGTDFNLTHIPTKERKSNQPENSIGKSGFK